MKKLLVLCFLIPFFGAAQIYQPALLYGKKENAHAIKRAAFFPSGCGNPSTLNVIDSAINQAASYFDSCAHRYWLYDPKLKAWDSVHVGAASLPYTITNGLTESPAGTVKLGGLLTGETIIEGGSNNYLHYNLGITRFQTTSASDMHFAATDGTDSSWLDIRRSGIANTYVRAQAKNTLAGTPYLGQLIVGGGNNGGVTILSTIGGVLRTSASFQGDVNLTDWDVASGRVQQFHMVGDTMFVRPSLGKLIIDTLTDVPGTKALRYNPANGLVSYADTSSGGGSYTTENAQDDIGTILVDDNTIDFTYNDGTPSITGAVRTQMSITSDASGIKLVADETTPTDGKFYGKVGGAKGWFTPAGGGITVGTTTITGGTDTHIGFRSSGVYTESANLTWNGNTLYTNAAATMGTLFQVAGLVPNYLMSSDATPGANEPYVMATHTSGYGILELSHGIGANFAIRNSGAGPLYIQSAAAQPVILFPAATAVLSASSTGVFIGGTTAATARAHIAGGTASVNTAPIQVNDGTKEATPRTGLIELQDHWMTTKSNAVRMGVPGSLKTITTDVGNVGSGVDDLQSYPVEAGTLSQDGDYIEFTMTFTFAENSNSKQVKVMYGGTQIYGSGAQAQVGGSMTVIGKVIRTGATTQKVTLIAISGAALFVDGSYYTTATETLSGAVTLKGTGEAVSNDDIIQVITTVQYFPAN